MGSQSTGGGNRALQRRVSMSPNQIRTATLRRASLGRRGYNEVEVDQLLEHLAVDVERWAMENNALKADNDRLKTALGQWNLWSDDGQGPAGPPGTALAERHICGEEYAHRAADHIRQQYEDVLGSAKEHARMESEHAALDYRIRAGERYTAEFEDLERRLVWARAFIGAIRGVEGHLRAAREALVFESNRLDRDLAVGARSRPAPTARIRPRPPREH